MAAARVMRCTRLIASPSLVSLPSYQRVIAQPYHNIATVRHASATTPRVVYEPFSAAVHGKPTWSLHSYGKDSKSTSSNETAVTMAELEKIASLSYINLNNSASSTSSNGGATALASQVASVVAWCGHVRDVNTDGVVPMLSPAENYPQLLRDDVVTDGNNAEGVLANAAHTDRGYILLPKTVDFSDT